MIHAALLGGYLAFWGTMGVAPVDRENWILASLLPLTFVGALVVGRRALPLSLASYALIAGFLALHTIGAHYTYARVPLGSWVQNLLALERNHFDRAVHFAFGLLLTYPLVEAFGRVAGVGPALRYGLAGVTQLGLAGAWEILECWVAQLAHPELGLAFVGAQGDVWDAQRDMLAAVVGTLLALALAAAATSRILPPGDLRFRHRRTPPRGGGARRRTHSGGTRAPRRPAPAPRPLASMPGSSQLDAAGVAHHPDENRAWFLRVEHERAHVPTGETGGVVAQRRPVDHTTSDVPCPPPNRERLDPPLAPALHGRPCPTRAHARSLTARR